MWSTAKDKQKRDYLAKIGVGKLITGLTKWQ